MRTSKFFLKGLKKWSKKFHRHKVSGCAGGGLELPHWRHQTFFSSNRQWIRWLQYRRQVCEELSRGSDKTLFQVGIFSAYLKPKGGLVGWYREKIFVCQCKTGFCSGQNVYAIRDGCLSGPLNFIGKLKKLNCFLLLTARTKKGAPPSQLEPRYGTPTM